MISATTSLSGTTAADPAAANHPLAVRMGAIGFLSYNLAVGCIMGSYGVLVAPIEAKLGITRDVSSLGIPAILLVIALIAPTVGVLSGKISIRLLMMVGAFLTAAGFIVLAGATNAVVFLAAYGLLLGPGMCLLGTMLPPTLITRWYKVNRGRALGIAHMPLLAAGISPLVALVLMQHGLTVTYIMLAGMMAVLLPALFFVVDYPPDAVEQRGEAIATQAAAGPQLNVAAFLGTGAFWMISLPFAAIVVGATIMAAHIVPMTMDWGIDATRAATLLAASSLGGMAGSVIFGWVADRLGPGLTLAIMCVNNAITWGLLMLQPPYEVILLLATSMGLHTAAIGPVVSLAFSQRFGQASFARVFGICNLVNLPFMMAGVPAAGYVYVRTGSYMGPVIGLIGFTLLGALCALNSRSSHTAKL